MLDIIYDEIVFEYRYFFNKTRFKWCILGLSLSLCFLNKFIMSSEPFHEMEKSVKYEFCVLVKCDMTLNTIRVIGI